MRNTYLKEIALSNYKFEQMPETVRTLAEYITYLLFKKLRVTAILNGSFQSHTTVAGYSDIDMLAIMDFDDTYKVAPEALVMAMAEMLMDSFIFLDVDVEYDPPAICVTHLSEPDYPIEITPAIRTADFGVYLGNETCDYMILDEQFTKWIATNPVIQRRTADYLNQQTSMGFSYLCGLLKLWNRTHKVQMRSFGIEVFLYHWLRENFENCVEFRKEHFSGIINLDFSCKPFPDTLEEGMLVVMGEMYTYLHKADQENEILHMVNPFVRMNDLGGPVFIFHSLEEQKRGLKELENAIIFFRQLVERKVEYSERKIKVFFGLGVYDDGK